MYYVYVIQSVDEEKKIYIGYSSNLKKRIECHNQGKEGWTKGRKWRLVYYEAYANEADARRRERKLKLDGRSKYHLMKRIEGSLKDMG